MLKELIKQAKDGDIHALNELIDNHKELAFSIAFKHLKNKEDAEDIVQNSFIIVLKAIESFRSEAKFSTWLYRIVYHECMKALKKKQLTVTYIPEFIEIPDDFEQEEEMNVNELLAILKPIEYTIITLFYLKEKSINEITKITSLSKANIKVILYRARQKMKQIRYEK